MKNYLGQTIWLTLLVGLLLTALSFLPKNLVLGEMPLRPMDIFADIRNVDSTALQPPANDTLPTAQPDTTTLTAPDSAVASGPLPPVDSLLFGTIFEDYSPEQHALDSFFQAIGAIKSGAKVRIAFFGDSFIEGDILLGDLRDTLQSLWGGNGVGFVPITSEVARFKRTLVHDYKGWNIYSIVKKTETHPPYGINGFVYTPFNGARVRYQGADWFRHTRSWSETRLFYSGDSLSSIQLSTNGAPAEFRNLPAHKGPVGAIEIRSRNFRSIAIDFPDPQNLRLYGAALEGGPGIYLDNFSVRGNSGGRLKQISVPMMQAFDKFQHYDLIVLQLGLNAATNSLNNISWYRQELDETFAHIKRCFPDKPILVISVPDRAGKVDGQLATMHSIPVIVAMQRDLARLHGFLFYDLFHGMGGPGAMIDFANRKPSLANKDYTHLTHEGGKEVSYIFARIFQAEQNRYLERLNTQNRIVQ